MAAKRAQNTDLSMVSDDIAIVSRAAVRARARLVALAALDRSAETMESLTPEQVTAVLREAGKLSGAASETVRHTGNVKITPEEARNLAQQARAKLLSSGDNTLDRTLSGPETAQVVDATIVESG